LEISDIVVAGDFNSEPESNVYHFITGQQPNFDISNEYYSEEKASLMGQMWETSGVKL